MGNKRDAIKRLVEQHAQIKDEPMEAAIWIRQDEPGVWLVEVLPELSDDGDVHEPVEFSPGRTFRFALHLIAGNGRSLKQAISDHADLAEWIARGEALYGGRECGQLMDFARKTLSRRQPQVV